MKRKSIAVAIAVSLLMGACNAATIQAYINLAVNIALQVAQLAGAPKSTADKVAADLAVVNKLVTDYGKADSSAKQGIVAEIDTVLNTGEADLNDIFSLTAVKDVKLQTTIRAALAIGITAIESIRALAIKNGGPTAASRTVHTITLGTANSNRIQSPDQLKRLYNLTVSDYPQARIN